MASGHLISLPSLRASSENGERETASPRAPRISQPVHTTGLCLPGKPSFETLRQPMPPFPTLPALQGRLPWEALPTHPAPGTSASSELLELFFSVPLSLSNAFHRHH